MIQTRALSYCYAGGRALRFPDVDVPQGSVLLLGGPSGSGKSTWLALVAGLLVASSGTVVVADQDLAPLKPAALDNWRARTIGFLPQKLHLSAALTVHQNLALAQWAAGRPGDDKRIHEALTALSLETLAARKPAQLSGGQAQRVALARAVLLAPRVVMADEPTASLDDESATAAVGLLHATCVRLDATLVMATHDSRVSALLEALQPVAIQSIRLDNHV